MTTDVSYPDTPELLTLQGEYDLGSAAWMSGAFASTGDPLEFDASAVAFIDSSGLHAIVDAAGTRGAVFVNASPAVVRFLLLMEQSGLPAGIECR